MFAIFYNGVGSTLATTGGYDVVLMAIPEPSAWVMLLGGFGSLLAFRRRP